MHNEEDKTLWDGAANIRVLNIKVAEKFKKLFDSWNVKTNVRLRECVYKRVTKKRDKPGFKSSMMTFTVSAIWVRSLSLDVFYLLTNVALPVRRLQVTISHSFSAV